MANLIITIISIALVAVAAIMGAYYGGQAFQEGMAKATANRLIKDAESLASAWKLWVVAQGGRSDLSDTSWTDGTSADLVPAYISQLIVYPNSITGSWTGDMWTPIVLETWTAGTAYTSAGNGIALGIDSNYQVCRYIAKAARGPDAEPMKRPGSNGSPANGLFECFYIDANANSAYDSGEALRAVYRVFN